MDGWDWALVFIVITILSATWALLLKQAEKEDREDEARWREFVEQLERHP